MDLQTMQEKIYAGFLGMNIGIRLGAPVEPAFWSYERIRDVYGEVRGYVKDFIHFAADDDANGPVFFLRCLNDTEGREPTPESVAEAWLNYAREGIGMFWWGGYGVSTEHTAYLNLKNGIPAPRSGSADQNGAVLAEQIGGQIFIDTWGLIAPGNPERAAGWARTAASVSHDGEGLNGAAFIAACIARAFNARSMDEIIRAGLSVIPPESLYAAVAKAVIDFHERHPEDWRACRAMLEAEWGYDRYPGACHIIPNAGVCVLALCYGGGDFSRTVEIATMCSWDTDCNAGNVGTIAGVFTGLAGIPEHYRTPINDHLILSGISGYLNSLDIPTYCRELADWALRLGGEAVPEAVRTVPEKGIHFDFSLPGSTHGFESTAPEICRIRHAREEDALEILLDRSTRGQAASVFYKPFYRRKDFSDERYMPVFSPQLYPGQKLRFALSWRKAAGEGILLTPYVRDSLTGKTERGLGEIVRESRENLELSFTVPDTDSGLLDEAGLIIEPLSPKKSADAGSLLLRDFRIEGSGHLRIRMDRMPVEFASVLPFSHLRGSWTVEGDRLHMLSQEGAESFTGPYFEKDEKVSCRILPAHGETQFVSLRVQGARRGYYAGRNGNGKAAIWKKSCGQILLLAESEVSWPLGEEKTVEFSARGTRLELSVDGRTAACTEDGELTYGMTGCGSFGPARCFFRDFEFSFTD